jgi:CRISPR-associated protein (TIGR02584 family)
MNRNRAQRKVKRVEASRPSSGAAQPSVSNQKPEAKQDTQAVLLAVTGMSPAILTETVWALAHENPPIIADEVVAITTVGGREAIATQLQTPLQEFGRKSVWQALRDDVLGAGAESDERLTLRVVVIERPQPATGGTTELTDIRNRQENLSAADFILSQVRHYSDAKDRRIIASLAGGRKTMGALLHAALSHLGRPQDRLTHILVNEPFDGGLTPAFFYPTQPAQLLTGRNGKTYKAGDAHLELADVPFAPLRVRFPDIADIPTRFRDLVRRYSETFNRDAGKPAVIELLADPPRVIVDGLAVVLESERQLTVLHFLFAANEQKWVHKSQYEAVALFKASQGYETNSDEMKSIRPALREIAGKLLAKNRGQPGPSWIASAANEDIKRPLSYLRKALERAGSSWKVPQRDLRFPPFRLVEKG